MMRGYDKADALAYITTRLEAIAPAELKDDLTQIVERLIDADMAYMYEAGVLDEEGNAGDSYYEDDDAIEYMVEHVATQLKFSPELTLKLALLTDDYLDIQQAYLEEKGLMDWE